MKEFKKNFTYCGFSQFLRADVRTAPRLGHDHLLPNTSEYITLHPALHSLSTDSSPQNMNMEELSTFSWLRFNVGRTTNRPESGKWHSKPRFLLIAILPRAV
jgi:hypothetical protein